MQILGLIVLILAVLWVLALCPGRGRKESMKVFSKQLIAHRGLHNNKGDAPENTLRAFSKAADAGFGIELDVRWDKDGEVVVCHDDSLKRVGKTDQKVSDLTYSQLQEISLYGSDQHVPYFKDVLKLVDGRVPLIVEIKSEDFRNAGKLAADTQKILDEFPQTVYCIESFNPAVVFWYRKHRPEIIRGQLSDRFKREKLSKDFMGMLFSCCAFNFLTRPDFIAYNHRQTSLFRFRLIRDLYHPSLVAWTIKNPKELENASEIFDVFIFDSFRPQPVKDIPRNVVKRQNQAG